MNLIESVTPIGKSNAIHQKELAERLGVAPTTVKNMVRQARQQGIEICSGIQGYWLAENDLERREFVSIMYKQGISRFKSASPIKHTLENMHGQISLSDTILEGGDANEQEEKDKVQR